MPELPEVETTCRGIRPHLVDKILIAVEVRETRLRWPVPAKVADMAGQKITAINRRAKYILIGLENGHTLLVHLGMSGSLRITRPEVDVRKHDHILVSLDSGMQLRYHDPRRFGCWLWTDKDPLQHKLIKNLGPEPLGDEFSADYLYQRCKNHKIAIKPAIMNAGIVVGVGNIYACEALFAAEIHPNRLASRISHKRIAALVENIKIVLQRSIAQGGTTLRDFLREDGQPGYFKQSLMVYGRENEPCKCCGHPIKRITLGQRSTFYCPDCQH